MTAQEMIERDVRLAIGDLSLQLIMAKARIAELENGTAPDLKNNGRVNPVPNGYDDEERPPPQ